MAQEATIINKDPYFIFPKAIFFFVNCVFYAVHGLLGIYLVNQVGLPVSEFGYISAVVGVNFLGALFWSNLADRTGQYKAILIFTLLGYALFMSLNAVHWEELIPRYLAIEYTKRVRLIVIMTLSALANFTGSAIFPIMDNVMLGLLASTPSFSKEMYGRQRLFGTIGHTAIAILVLLMKKSLGHDFMYFVMIGSAVISSLLVYFGIPAGVHAPEHLAGHGHHGPAEAKKPAAAPLSPQRSDTPHSVSSQVSASDGSINKNAMLLEQSATAASPAPPAIPLSAPTKTQVNPVVALFSIPAFWLFLSFVFLAGYIRSVMGSFAPLLLDKSKKNDDDHLWFIAQQIAKLASELSVYFYGKELNHQLGVHWMLLLSQFFGLLRVAGYGFMPARSDALWMTVVFELLKGFNTGFFFGSAVKVANEIAPKGCGNTAQGIFSGVYSGLSAAAAGGLAGFQISFYENDPSTTIAQGIKVMFQTTLYAGAFITAAFMFKFAVIDRVIFVGKRTGAASHA